MLVSFHRMLKMLDGFWKDCTTSREPLPLGDAPAAASDGQPLMTQGELYWAYVPDPPILHPSVWESPEIPVYVSDTHSLGLPSSSHL